MRENYYALKSIDKNWVKEYFYRVASHHSA